MASCSLLGKFPNVQRRAPRYRKDIRALRPHAGQPQVYAALRAAADQDEDHMIRWEARYALRIAGLAQPSPHWPSALSGWQIRGGAARNDDCSVSVSCSPTSFRHERNSPMTDVQDKTESAHARLVRAVHALI
jgi:hypothetical protein